MNVRRAWNSSRALFVFSSLVTVGEQLISTSAVFPGFPQLYISSWSVPC